MSSHSILETGGMIYINAYQDGKELKLRDNAKLEIRFPNITDKDQMSLFNGIESENGINWVLAEPDVENNLPASEINFTEGLEFDVIIDTLTIRESFTKHLNTTSLKWINCDRFLNNMNTTALTINSDSSDNPQIYIVFKSINSIMPVYTYGKKTNYTEKVPIGMDVTVIAYSINSDEVFFSEQSFKTQRNQNIELNFKKIALEDFEKEIKKFD